MPEYAKIELQAALDGAVRLYNAAKNRIEVEYQFACELNADDSVRLAVCEQVRSTQLEDAAKVYERMCLEIYETYNRQISGE